MVALSLIPFLCLLLCSTLAFLQLLNLKNVREKEIQEAYAEALIRKKRCIGLCTARPQKN